MSATTTNTVSSKSQTRNISTYAGVVGFGVKAAVTGVSFVGGLVVAAANAAASTEIGLEIHQADGIKGAVELGVDLSFRMVDNLVKDKVAVEVPANNDEAFEESVEVKPVEEVK